MTATSVSRIQALVQLPTLDACCERHPALREGTVWILGEPSAVLKIVTRRIFGCLVIPFKPRRDRRSKRQLPCSAALPELPLKIQVPVVFTPRPRRRARPSTASSARRRRPPRPRVRRGTPRLRAPFEKTTSPTIFTPPRRARAPRAPRRRCRPPRPRRPPRGAPRRATRRCAPRRGRPPRRDPRRPPPCRG